MVRQGYHAGSCSIKMPNGSLQLACQSSLKKDNNQWYRLIISAHLSRPEDYFSIYQSGCNHSCLKCHSWEFSQIFNGFWVSIDELAQMAADYELIVTVRESRNRATAWHASDLCKHCGLCMLEGRRGEFCPRRLDPSQIVHSPQGYGPARNIIAFTGGDLACKADFYAQATERMKNACQEKMWVLLETNGYGLTPENLEKLASAGLDSFWLDVKAYDSDVYRRLCGTTNEWILSAPERILDMGFVLEVLSLYIPNWVETDQIVKIAELIRGVDESIPFTLLAFFPEYKLSNNRSPTTQEMLRTYLAVRDVGLKNVKLGNCHVFAKSEEEWGLLIAIVGKEGIG